MKYNREYTPEFITELKDNEIFVFGSNIHGMHGGGAAALAFRKFGAEWGVGEGVTGKCYALPTMVAMQKLVDNQFQIAEGQCSVSSSSETQKKRLSTTGDRGVDYVEDKVKNFLECAKQHPELKFYVTRVGCGIAGFLDSEIGPLFKDAIEMPNVILPKEFVEEIEK